MAAATAPTESPVLLNLAPKRSIAELLSEPIKYVPARHPTETPLPTGLEPVNVTKPQRQTQPHPPPPLATGSGTKLENGAKSNSADAHQDDDIGQRVSVTDKELAAVAWPTGVSGAAHGLTNNGNTCYLNATLQGLMHLPAMLSVLPRLHSPQACERRHVCTLCKLIALVQGAFKGHLRSLLPTPILNLLKKIAPHFRRFAQEDAHEFLRLLLDSCVESDVSPKQLKQNPRLKDTSAVHRLFGGRFCSRVQCKNGHNSDTYDTFLDVSVQLTRNTQTLQDCFNLFTSPDKLHGANRYKCEKCKALVNADKFLSIQKAPFILTVHIKRFSPLRQKISAPISYPETLDLRPWMTEPGRSTCYRLDGIICHSGSSANSGHYYSYVRTSNGSWYRQDDTTSSPVSKFDRHGLFQMRQAYVLLYSRIDRDFDSSSSSDASETRRTTMKADDSVKILQQHVATSSVRSPVAPGKSSVQNQLGKRKQPPESDEPARPSHRPRVLSDAGLSNRKPNPFSTNRPQSAQGHYSRPPTPTSPASTSANGSFSQHQKKMSMPASFPPKTKKLDRPPAPADSFFGKHTNHYSAHRNNKHQRHHYGNRHGRGRR